jgi:hypothetical protein
MNLIKTPSLIILYALLLIISNITKASNFNYYGPQLQLNYSGPIIVDNSRVKYTSLDKLTFNTEQYLLNQLPTLLPLRESIDTWAAMLSIHPQLLAEVLQDYFENRTIDTTFETKQLVFQISTGIRQALNEDNDPISASRALVAISNAYEFRLDLPVLFAEKRTFEDFDFFKGSSGPPLFGYLQPPWPRGELWASGGVHTNTGSGSSPRNSIDIFKNFVNWGGDTSNSWASASQSGIARVWSSCSVSIIHPNGWETSYYHLDNVQVSNFQSVVSNQRIANYADNEPQALCQGGSSTGPHAHVSVYYNGTAIEIDEPNLDFTSWKLKAGIGNYDSNCNNSYYTLLPSNFVVCPFFRQLPNNTTAENIIFENGFELN